MIKLKSLLTEDNEYDSSLDYDIHHNPPSALVKIVDQILQDKNTQTLIKALNINTPKISYIRDNKREALARYIAGTSSNPHIVLDLDTIESAVKNDSSNLGYAIESTIIHELIHAYLESKGLDPSEHDEDVVESATMEYMDFRDPADAVNYINNCYPHLD
jgi:hypothetical protein